MKKVTEIDIFNPCEDGLKFVKSCASLKEAWETCERGDWMLWAAKMIGVPLRPLTLAKGYCAKTVIHLMKDQRSIDAINIAIKFGKGKATRYQLNKAADAATTTTAAYAAAAAAYAATAAAAAYAADAAAAAATAAYAAAYAADAAAAAATAAYAAAYAATAAATAAAYAATAAAAAYATVDVKIEYQRKTADICRKYLTKEIVKRIKI